MLKQLKSAYGDGASASQTVATRAGTSVANIILLVIKLIGFVVDGLLTFVWAFGAGFIKKIPKIGPSVGDSLINAGNKIKLGGSDVICNVIYSDGVVIPRKAQYLSEDKAFETDNGEKFSTKGIGFNPVRLNGRVPTVWALRMGHEITEPLEAAIVNAVKMGRFQEFTRSSGEADIAVDVDPNGYDYGPGVGRPRQQAMTDGGGVAKGKQLHGDVGGVNPGYDGTILSFRDAYHLFGSMVTQEDMQQQETRGKLAVLDWDRRDQMKLVFMVIVAFALGLFGPSIAGQIAGASGGAVSGGMESFGLSILPGVWW